MEKWKYRVNGFIVPSININVFKELFEYGNSFSMSKFNFKEGYVLKDTEFVYIYNSNQGIYYIKNGLVPVDFGTASKGDAYMKFKVTDQYKKLFRNWCNEKK